MPLALYMLAMAVFAMGTSEFMLAGLLPDIATSLDVSLGAAGLLTSMFAVGMVLGAPLTAALARDWPARNSLIGLVLVFAAAHIAGALTTSFPILLTTRIVAALANAGFLAVAVATATKLVAHDQKGRSLAVLLSGTTVATIAGVPGGAVLATLLDWRATFWAIAFLCLPAILGVTKGIPARTDESEHRNITGVALRTEITQLAQPRLLLAMFLGAMINAATFGTYTYLAPIVTASGLAKLWVSAALVLFGIGSFLGITAAGRLSDQRPRSVIAVGGPLVLLGWIALAILASHPVALLILVFVQGALSFGLGSTLIARVLYEAAGAPTLGGSYATAALNIGAACGPLLAAASLDPNHGNLGPVWTSCFLVAIALTLVPALIRSSTPEAAAQK